MTKRKQRVEFTEWELAVAQQAARRIGPRWDGIETDDVYGDLCLWLMENYRHVLRYRGLGKEGRAKFAASLYRRANGYCSSQARKMVIETLDSPDTDDLYTQKEVEVVLALMLNGQQELAASAGHDVWSRMADVASAWTSLKPADKKLLAMRYGKDMQFDAVGRELGIEPDAARMRVGRAIERLRLRASQSWAVPQSKGRLSNVSATRVTRDQELG